MRRLLLLALSVFILSATLMAAEVQPSLLDRKIQHFTASGSIQVAVSRLASSVAGFEAEESITDITAKSGVEAPIVSVSVQDKTVKEILDTLIAQDKRYTYIVSSDWINLVPASVINDPNYVYNRHIPGEITLSTDPAKNTTISAWMQENKIGTMLLGLGNMKLKLPVPTQTVTLTNPTLRDYTNWKMRLCGRNRWYGSSKQQEDGRTVIKFHYSVISSDD